MEAVMTKSNSIDDAKRVVADLNAKLAEVEERQRRLALERDEISYAAHAEKSDKARKRLTMINQELVIIGSEADGLRAARRSRPKPLILLAPRRGFEPLFPA
jgi:hypothetical protein